MSPGKGGAQNGIRTRDLILTKDVLCQLSYLGPGLRVRLYRAVKEMVGREGIEPPQSKTADLQSAELTTCSTYPRTSAELRAEAASPWCSRCPIILLEPTTGLEPGTGGLQNRCSTN